MRVLILNQTFYPDVAATAQHMWDLARYLRSAGHDVVAIASRNVYGTDQKAFAAHEAVEGITIYRVGGTALGKKSIVHRLLDFASFYLSASWRLFWVRPKPDVIIALTSPPMISAAAALVAGLRRIRFVYYVMDVYPEAAVVSGVFKKGGLADRLFTIITGWTIKRADKVIALGRDMRDLLISHYGAKRCRDKITIATPWADGREIFPIARDANPLIEECGLRDTFNIVYSGNFGVAHDVDTIVQAIELTREDSGLRWVFIGGGKRLAELQAQAQERKWPHVKILPYQPREKLNESLNMADVHLISQLPAFTGIVVPSKLFGIMAAGKPAIMIGPKECEVSRILLEQDAGTLVANGDAAGLVDAIHSLRRDPELAVSTGRCARAAFESRYASAVICAKVAESLGR